MLLITILTILYGQITKLNRHVYLTKKRMQNIIANWSKAYKIETTCAAKINIGHFVISEATFRRKPIFVNCANTWEPWAAYNMKHFKLPSAVLAVCSTLEPQLTRSGSVQSLSALSFLTHQGIPGKDRRLRSSPNHRHPFSACVQLCMIPLRQHHYCDHFRASQD